MAGSDLDIERELKHLPLETTTLLGTANTSRIVSRWLIGILLVLLAIMFLPWQQNVQGMGYVTALSPADRPSNCNHVSMAASRPGMWQKDSS